MESEDVFSPTKVSPDEQSTPNNAQMSPADVFGTS